MLARLLRAFDSIRTLLHFDNGIQLVMGRLFFRKTTLLVHRLNHMQMLIDHRASDAGSLVFCLIRDAYEDYLKSIELPQRTSVLDIGANVGGFSLALENRGNHPEKLVCVELNPQTCERLRFNIKNNIGLHARVLNNGLWGKEETLNIELGPGDTHDSIQLGAPEIQRAATQKFAIQAVTLNSLIESNFGDEKIDLCKIDIEAAEVEVFLGAPENSTRIMQVRYLIIEIHSADTYPELLQKFETLGFKLLCKETKKAHEIDEPGVHLFENTKLD